MKIDLDTWLIADTHFFHKNMIKLCGRPTDHNTRMAFNWKQYVKPEDTILHLGDLTVWYNKVWINDGLQVAKGLPGKKYIIRGNHDHHLTDEQFAKVGFQVVPEFIKKIKGVKILFSHAPDYERSDDWDINIHGHIHNNEEAYSITTLGHINISVEVTDYKPIQLSEILS